jgi:hypothetical protein
MVTAPPNEDEGLSLLDKLGQASKIYLAQYWFRNKSEESKNLANRIIAVVEKICPAENKPKEEFSIQKIQEIQELIFNYLLERRLDVYFSRNKMIDELKVPGTFFQKHLHPLFKELLQTSKNQGFKDKLTGQLLEEAQKEVRDGNQDFIQLILYHLEPRDLVGILNKKILPVILVSPYPKSLYWRTQILRQFLRPFHKDNNILNEYENNSAGANSPFVKFLSSTLCGVSKLVIGQILLDYGANKTAKSSTTGNTWLHMSLRRVSESYECACGHCDILNTLIVYLKKLSQDEQKIMHSEKNTSGLTPWQYMCKTCKNEAALEKIQNGLNDAWDFSPNQNSDHEKPHFENGHNSAGGNRRPKSYPLSSFFSTASASVIPHDKLEYSRQTGGAYP